MATVKMTSDQGPPAEVNHQATFETALSIQLPRSDPTFGQQKNIVTTDSPLLSLPPELRTKIYRYVLGDRKVHIIGQSNGPKGIVCECDSDPLRVHHRLEHTSIHSREKEEYLDIALLFVCRQIHEEAQHVLYSTTIFTFRVSEMAPKGFTPAVEAGRWSDLYILARFIYSSAHLPSLVHKVCLDIHGYTGGDYMSVFHSCYYLALNYPSIRSLQVEFSGFEEFVGFHNWALALLPLKNLPLKHWEVSPSQRSASNIQALQAPDPENPISNLPSVTKMLKNLDLLCQKIQRLLEPVPGVLACPVPGFFGLMELVDYKDFPSAEYLVDDHNGDKWISAVKDDYLSQEKWVYRGL